MRRIKGFLAAASLIFATTACEPNTVIPRKGTFVKPIARLGGADGPISLNEIGAIGIEGNAPDTAFVIQWQVPYVAVFSSVGALIREIGREGNGPGEFSQPVSLAVENQDIWIVDYNGDLTHFATDGTLERSVRYEIPDMSRWNARAKVVQVLPGGAALVQGQLQQLRVASGGDHLAPIGIVDSTGFRIIGEVVRTGTAYQVGSTGQPGVIGTPPIDVGGRVLVDPKGRWIVIVRPVPDAAVASLSWITLQGDTLRTRTLRARQVPAGAALGRWTRRFASEHHMRPDVAADALVQAGAWPSTLPAVSDGFADQDGRTWLKTPHERSDSAVWVVLDERGIVDVSVTLPSRINLMAATGQIVWGSTLGPYDVPYLMQFLFGV